MLRCLFGLIFVLSAFPGQAQERARIALIIDDMGYARDTGRAALGLPGPITYAFLPHTPYAEAQARRAHATGKEVMLHMPMQALSGGALGPVALTLHMTEPAMVRALEQGLASVPHVSGVNNHMGSLLTAHPGAMQWVMEVLRRRKLYFIDSRTTKETVAEVVAQENAVPVARRDVFLDADNGPAAIRAQFDRLIGLARKQGAAVGIGHARWNTLRVLAQELPRLEDLGIELVPASALTHEHLRRELWHVSSYPSPKVVKNSKP